MSDNIVHLVLAKLPNSPEGVKGISLFIVPKFYSNENGQEIKMVPEMLNLLGCSKDNFKKLLK